VFIPIVSAREATWPRCPERSAFCPGAPCPGVPCYATIPPIACEPGHHRIVNGEFALMDPSILRRPPRHNPKIAFGQGFPEAFHIFPAIPCRPRRYLSRACAILGPYLMPRVGTPPPTIGLQTQGGLTRTAEQGRWGTWEA